MLTTKIGGFLLYENLFCQPGYLNAKFQPVGSNSLSLGSYVRDLTVFLKFLWDRPTLQHLSQPNNPKAESTHGSLWHNRRNSFGFWSPVPIKWVQSFCKRITESNTHLLEWLNGWVLAKAGMTKCDPYLVPFDIRNTPQEGIDASPVQRTMNRWTRSPLLTPANLTPQITTGAHEKIKQRQAIKQT